MWLNCISLEKHQRLDAMLVTQLIVIVVVHVSPNISFTGLSRSRVCEVSTWYRLAMRAPNAKSRRLLGCILLLSSHRTCGGKSVIHDIRLPKI
jgi:hypothetical protein